MIKYIYFKKNYIFKIKTLIRLSWFRQIFKKNSINILFKSLYAHILICIALVVNINYNNNSNKSNRVSRKLMTFNNQKNNILRRYREKRLS